MKPMTRAEVVWLRAAPLLLFAAAATALIVDSLIRDGLSDVDLTFILVAGFVVIAVRNAIGHVRAPVLSASRVEAVAYATVYVAGAIFAVIWIVTR